jgi:tetratricopeptide (TPR) repeat protein
LVSREKIIQSLGLSAAATRLSTAQLYAGERLLQRATDQLQAANELSGRELSLLGELAIRMQRLDLAEAAYRRAISNIGPDDTEGLAVAHKMLGRLIASKEPLQAKKFLHDASAAYARLGDEREVAGIARLLRQL